MILLKPSIEILRLPTNVLEDLELFGRVCYKSEDRITPESANRFIDMIVNDKHHYSVLRHKQATVRMICSRSISHQIVRHGLAHFLQESQRFCNYSKKNNGEIQFIIPFYLQDAIPEGRYKEDIYEKINYANANGECDWLEGMLFSEHRYHDLIAKGWKPERARGVLPNDCKTELILSANLEEWRHIFKQRADSHADESMQHLMFPLLAEFKKAIPIIFDDISC
jgi:thymidylate synthase (FAD)